MDTTRKILSLVSMFAAVMMLLASSGCKKDETTQTPLRTATYDLKAKEVLGLSGKATFTETSSTTTTIDITLTGPYTGGHPVQLLSGSTVEDGTVLLVLNPVDATGKSSTLVTTMTFTELTGYDGYINVLESIANPGKIIAQGDIGGNALTTTNKTYNLVAIDPFNITGTAKFEKRVNGNTLVTLTFNTTDLVTGDEYPATINLGSIATVGGGDVKKTLNNVIGNTGKSYTNIRTLNNGTAITYDDWMVYDGYINVYQNSVDISNIICHGNIGSN
jgi:hypothetical protein